jgi:hypothetical protein
LTQWSALGAMTATVLALVHNDSLAFVAANALLLSAGPGKRLHRALAVVGAGGVPVAVWVIVRRVLEQQHSAAVGIGAGRYTAITYVRQALSGVGSLIVPDRYGAPFAVVVAMAAVYGIVVRRREGADALVFGGAFVGLSAAATYALFNLSWVDDRLAGRFLLFVPLTLVPLLFLASARWSRPLFVACVTVVLVPQFYWTARWFQLRATTSVEAQGYPTAFATPAARLSVDYPQGPPVRTERGVVLAPQSWEASPEGTR